MSREGKRREADKNWKDHPSHKAGQGNLDSANSILLFAESTIDPNQLLKPKSKAPAKLKSRIT